MSQDAKRGQRELAESADYGESQPLSEFIVTTFRYLPLILVLGLLAGLAVFVLTAPKPPTPTAASQVGLTREVVWPFYDSARLRAVTTVEDESFRSDLVTRLATVPVEDLSVDMPDNQTFVVIEVTSDVPANAVVAANAAADLLIERDLEREGAEAEAALAQAEATLQAGEDRVADIDIQIAAVVPVEAEARAAASLNPNSSAARERLLNAELERSGLTQARSEEIRRQVELRIDVDEARAAIDAVLPELEVLVRASPPPESPERSYIPVLAAFIAAMIGGLGLSIMWDRARGTLSSRWHADHVAGVTVLADIDSRSSWRQSVDLFLNTVLESGSSSGNIVALTGLKGIETTGWLSFIVRYLEASGFRIVAVTKPSSDLARMGYGKAVDVAEVRQSTNRRELLNGVSTILLPHDLSLLDVSLLRPALTDVSDGCDLVLLDGGTIGDDESEQALAMADMSVILARRNVNRVDQLRAAARRLRTRRGRFLGVVLLAQSTPGRSRMKVRASRSADDRVVPTRAS